jgi:hypothetical protein
LDITRLSYFVWREDTKEVEAHVNDRSRLLKKVLETWDYSEEGQQYLIWLIKPEAANLDGGDILREAVLDVMEEDDYLQVLRVKEMEQGLEEFFKEVQLPPSTESSVREHSFALVTALSKWAEGIRSKVQVIAELRRALKRNRLETLEIVTQLINSEVQNNEMLAFRRFELACKGFDLAEDLAARVTALSRTTAERLNPEEEWRKLSFDGSSFQDPRRESADEELISERLGQYYSYQLVSRLETIVRRGSTLQPMNIEVKSQSVSRLFREAHEVFLHGFDAASIALCRSLVDQALRDKLSVPQDQQQSLKSMIERAEREKLIDRNERGRAETVRKAGNEVVHDVSKVSNLQDTAADVLDCTRIVLNKLYAQ